MLPTKYSGFKGIKTLSVDCFEVIKKYLAWIPKTLFKKHSGESDAFWYITIGPLIILFAAMLVVASGPDELNFYEVFSFMSFVWEDFWLSMVIGAAVGGVINGLIAILGFKLGMDGGYHFKRSVFYMPGILSLYTPIVLFIAYALMFSLFILGIIIVFPITLLINNIEPTANGGTELLFKGFKEEE